MKKTEWYEGHQKPIRRGVYERQYPIGTGYARFNGKIWLWRSDNVDVADRTPDNMPSDWQNQFRWRGLEGPA